MGAGDDRFFSVRRVLAVALFLGVASVGLGSSAGALRRPAPSTASAVGQTLTTVLLVTTSVLGAGLLWVASQGARRRRGQDDQPQPVPQRLRGTPAPLLLLLGLLALAGPWLLLRLPTAPPSPAGPRPPTPTTTPTTVGALPSAPPSHASGTWPVWVLAVLLVAAVAVVLVAARWPARRPGPGDAPEAPPATDAAPVAPVATAAPPPPATASGAGSPREAVVAAYGAASDALHARGLGREPSETPDEYAERVRREVAAMGRAAAELTDGYQRVRFSDAVAEPADAQAAWSAAHRVLEALGCRP
jgi:hypothetical protein